jgi:hypothetical protein
VVAALPPAGGEGVAAAVAAAAGDALPEGVGAVAGRLVGAVRGGISDALRPANHSAAAIPTPTASTPPLSPSHHGVGDAAGETGRL